MRIASLAAILLANCAAMHAVASQPTPAPTAPRGDVPLLARPGAGTMRDDGGYNTTHALWALDIAHRNGCIAASEFEPCVRSIQKELVAAQPLSLVPQATLDIDLFSERLLTLILTGYSDPIVNQWAQNRMHLQGPDGSWGVPHDGEQPYYRYHTTATAAWALTEWYRRQVAGARARQGRLARRPAPARYDPLAASVTAV